MAHIKCNTLILKSEMEQARCLYYSMISLVILMEMEQFRRHKAIKTLKLPLSEQTNSFERLLIEGTIYLNMMNGLFLNTHDPQNFNLFHFLFKSLDLYMKLKLKFQDLLRLRQQLFEGHDIEYCSEEGLAVVINFNNVDGNHRFLNIEDETYEVEEHEVMDTFDLLTALHFRICMYTSAVWHIKKIKKIYMNRFLYSILWEYGKKLRRFLYNNKAGLQSCTFARENNSPKNFCCKYHILKELVRRTDQSLMFHTNIVNKLKHFINLDIQEHNELMIIKHTQLIRRNEIAGLAKRLNIGM